MSASSFIEYAASPNLSSDEIFTIELLIEHARRHIEENYYAGGYMERNDRREQPGYIPSFPMEFLSVGAEFLANTDWISLQRIRGNLRPVRSLEAIRHLSELTGLALGSNEIADLKPIQGCPKLKKLLLNDNHIRDTSSLAQCAGLEELEIRENPLEDFSGFRSLGALRVLEISTEQLGGFSKRDILKSLESLHFGLGEFEDFTNFPDLPRLKVLRSAHVRDLNGIERFASLQNLVNMNGEFSSLEPLRYLANLTHINILGSRVRTAEPLSNLLMLRELFISTSEPSLDISSLDRLPALHDISVRCQGSSPANLDDFRGELSSWDIEFRSESPRYTPSLEIEVVDQAVFDFYDVKQGYGLLPTDTNESLLSSELDWIDEQVDAVLKIDFEEDEDYCIPFHWSGARSRTVMLMSERAVEAFPRLVLQLQEILCNARYDWIIYFQSECFEMPDDDFIVWLYPDRIVTTQEYANIVRKLAGD